jgi:hypothetical protein
MNLRESRQNALRVCFENERVETVDGTGKLVRGIEIREGDIHGAAVVRGI